MYVLVCSCVVALQLAQLRHALTQKEGLLKLYAQDANETGDEGEGEGEGRQAEWIRALTEECRELREGNLTLTAEVSYINTSRASPTIGYVINQPSHALICCTVSRH